MDVLNNPPVRLRQDQNGLCIFLSLAEWPASVPLPPDCSIVGLGENHELLIYPQWRFRYTPDHVREVLSGLFRVSLSLADTAEWFRRELAKRGWVENTEKVFREATWASLNFQDPATGFQIEMRLRYRPALDDTEIMIRRVSQHPLTPTTEPQAELPDTFGPDDAC